MADGLNDEGIRVVFTRTDDRFVTLAERAGTANRAAGDLYLSIHANSAEDQEASGPETYFLSLEASDKEAMRVAMTENQVFGQEAAVPDSDDIVGNILGDLILTDHLRASSRVAAAIQRNLARLAGGSRGVKQAPFVVLMGVNMPAALIEIGFLTNAEEAEQLRTEAYQERIADAVVRAVKTYRDARYGPFKKEAAR
jgi:N-acetylmuramoyl-L-alanine amidase